MIVIGIAAATAAVGLFLFKAAPRLAMIAWGLTLFFVPIWVGISFGIFFTAIASITLLCIVTASLRGFRWSSADTVLLVFLALIGGSYALGKVTFGHLLIAGLDWIVPYIWGRLALARVQLNFVTSVIAVMTVMAAVLAILEFVSGTNPFVLIPWGNSGYALWSGLQPRGGFLRAEGAFGHSISLGASLSIGSLFVLTARWPLAVRLAALSIVGAAIVVSFSRIGLVCFAVGIILSIVFLGDLLNRRTRLVVATMLAISSAAVLPFISNVFTAAGDEAEGSAFYRVDLLSLVPQMAPLGLSPAYTILPDNSVYVGAYESIDSALILTGLRLGYIPLVLLVCLLVATVVLVLARRANVALVAVAAQIPGLATVALITQLPYLLWFVAGLGVSLYILDHDRAQDMSMSRIAEVNLKQQRERFSVDAGAVNEGEERRSG